MRTRKRVILLGLGLLAIGGTAFAVPTVWFKPYTVNHLYARIFARLALQSPMMLSHLQLVPPALDFYSGKLDNRSVEFAEKQRRQLERDLRILRSYDRDSLSDQLSYDVAEWAGADMLAAQEFRLHGYPLNQVSGEQSAVPSFMLSSHRIHSARDARHYVARLEQFDRYFFHVLEDLHVREKRGITPPRFVLDRVLAEMRAFISQPPTKHVLYTHLLGKLDSVPDIDALERAAVLARADSALTEQVYPAYVRLIAYAEHLARSATTDDGVWKLPDGDRYYQYQLRRHTTTDMTADQIHQLGLQEVARIQAEIRKILRAQGHASADVAATSAALFRGARFQWRDSAAGRAAILAEYQRIIDELEDVPFFRKVVRFTAFSEGWALYAEQLAAEAGFQDDPYDRLGYLLDQLLRAVRLVVDTGIHDKRWTRQQAIDYMRKQTGRPESEVVAEIERYIVMPGHATSYMVGYLKILELRERARQKLGDRFNLREFHTVVLRNGEIPLVLLERTVDEWIASRSQSPPRSTAPKSSG